MSFADGDLKLHVRFVELLCGLSLQPAIAACLDTHCTKQM